MHLNKGLLIVFEGNEGAGKSTVLAAIATRLANQAVEVVKTREPGGTALGEQVRELLLQSNPSATQGLSICDKAELLLFLAARAQNIEEVIKPALAKGACVLCDRFNDSTIAYQGCARGVGLEEVERLCKWVCGDLVPDLTFFLTVDPTVGLKRAHQASGKFDRIESEAGNFHARVQEGFHKIAALHPNHFTVVDANREKDVVVDEVWKAITAKLEL